MKNQIITLDFGSEAIISSFDLLIQINNFREQESKRILNHGDLLKIIIDPNLTKKYVLEKFPIW